MSIAWIAMDRILRTPRPMRQLGVLRMKYGLGVLLHRSLEAKKVVIGEAQKNLGDFLNQLLL